MRHRTRWLTAWLTSTAVAFTLGRLLGAGPARVVSASQAPAAPARPAVATSSAGPAADAPACPFVAGARPSQTLPGVVGHALPIKHVIVLMQENRSFDHYFGRLAAAGQPDAEVIPPHFGNPNQQGDWVRPFHLPTTCIPRDPPHQWENMHTHWNQGRMDRFVVEAAAAHRPNRHGSAQGQGEEDEDDDLDDATAGGQFALGYYDERDLPFYYHLANTFTIADRYFSAAMAGTWPNRQFLYTGTAQRRSAPTAQLTGARSLFDSLDDAGVAWAVYTDGPARQDCIGWPARARGVRPTHELFAALRTGALPPVSFLDPADEDEHPPADVQRGEGWARRLYLALTDSPAWRDTVLFMTYDEGGGFFDHVPPPPACAPSPDRPEYDRRGTRVPLLVVSPWARRHAVSHAVHDHASVLRFIELVFDLPALSARDANADALLDAFDFQAPPRLAVPQPPPSGRGGCRALHRSSPAIVAARDPGRQRR